MSSGIPMVNMAATGANIKALIKANGLKVSDIQNKCGFNTPQSIFKWMRGDAMPSIDNLVILAYILNVTIDEIIVVE
ncbi:MAG: helix-turn-helix transcriptional regulator [Ruminococcus sp.]|nr:helix-turn-helix transcriptional regulator [Ruminococcus sp.]MBQ1431873.1 helix-turn-helix transcriptional regulator [Ruminococcus sp.]